MINDPNMIYVVFAGTEMLKAYKSRDRADHVARRLTSFNEFRFRREWELSSADWKLTCYNNDYENFAADVLTYYSVRAVRFDADVV